MKTNLLITKDNKQIRKSKLNLIRFIFLIQFTVEIIIYVLYWGKVSLTRFMSYLTEWGYIITVFFLVCSYFQIFKEKKLFHSKLFHVCLAVEFLITVFYWAVLYKFSDHDDNIQLYFNVSKHLVPFLYLLIEFVHYNLPLHFASIYQLTLLIVCYAINNFVITIFWEMEIYKVITWKDSTSLIYIVIALSLSLIGWTIFFQLNKKYQVVQKLKQIA